jgi:hypothetical protein
MKWLAFFPSLSSIYNGNPMSSQVTQKPGRTNLKLNISSHHYSQNKQVLLPILLQRARALCDQDSAHAELAFLKITAVTGRYLGPTIQEGYSIQTEFSFGTQCSFVCKIFIYTHTHTHTHNEISFHCF